MRGDERAEAQLSALHSNAGEVIGLETAKAKLRVVARSLAHLERESVDDDRGEPVPARGTKR